jgi:CRISPR-associated endonuclease Csy4
MNRYLDVKIKPDAEMPENWLLNKVYTKLHKAIFDLLATDIGISFPQAKIKLGCIIRIHSTQKKLQQLQSLNWLGGLSSYCIVSEILLIGTVAILLNPKRLNFPSTDCSCSFPKLI